MKLGLMLPIGVGALGDGRPVRWSEICDIAMLAEAIGFDSLLVPDHLLFRRSPPGSAMPIALPEGKTRGIWEAWTILGAVAAVTRRVEIGPLVACTSFRNPALLAKMADTLDEVSGGRLVLGLGAGWHEPEYEAFGYPFDHRVSRFEEALRIVTGLLREGRVDFQGTYYQVRDCELSPRGPRPQGPPILIGAQGPRMLRLCARYADRYDADFQIRSEGVATRFAALEAACRDAGRDPRTLVRAAATRVSLAAPSGAEEVSARVAPPRDGVAEYEMDGVRFPARHGSAEEILAHLRGFAALGVEYLTVNVVHPPGRVGLERLAPLIPEAKGERRVGR